MLVKLSLEAKVSPQGGKTTDGCDLPGVDAACSAEYDLNH